MTAHRVPVEEQERRAWEVAQRMEIFSIYKLSAEAQIRYGLVRKFVPVWARQGLITWQPQGRRRRKLWRVVELPAPIARPGSTPAENMWRSVRKLGPFTLSDVQMVANIPSAPVSDDDAAAFVRMLMRAGYLKCIRKRIPGRSPAQYRLIRDTGPVPPVEKRIRAVWDANRGEYTYLPEPGQ